MLERALCCPARCRRPNPRAHITMSAGFAKGSTHPPRASSGEDYASRADGRSGCSPIGARPFQAITSIAPAVVNIRRPSPCWWTRCDTGADLRGSLDMPKANFAAKAPSPKPHEFVMLGSRVFEA